ncbi:MAG TPA: helix-turn-helix transcriptional regulator [Streptosporangiaceae bacterium]|nr:helix-turn-helix transcriptional regulator [Streptosporangiaceae bacterium]
MREFGRRVRLLRKRAGTTGKQLADVARVSQPTISKIETGRILPSLDVVERIVTALGAGPDAGGSLRDELVRGTPTAPARQVPVPAPGAATLTVQLTAPVAGVLAAEAARRGESPDQVAADLLAAQLADADRAPGTRLGTSTGR